MRPRRVLLLLVLLAAAATLAVLPGAAQAKTSARASVDPATSAHGKDPKPPKGKHDGDDDDPHEDAGEKSAPPAGPSTVEASAPAPAPAAKPDVRDPATVPSVDPRLADLANEALAQDPSARLHVLVFGSDPKRPVAGETVAAADLADFAAAPGIAYVMCDVPVLPTAAADASAPLTPMPFTKLVGAPAAWRHGLSGRGVGIAVIDSGVTRTEDFPGARLVQVRLDGQTAPLDDLYGHGTFVAAIAGGANGAFRGVAPGARVFALNVSRGDGVYTSDVIAGLQWVLANHARLHIRVATLALSETAPSSYRVSPLDTVVEQLWRAGVVVVASAGNLGPGTALFAPANDPFAITVGALDTNGRAAAFSSNGTTPDGFGKPELLAPGRHIASALPAGTFLAGLAPAANVVAPGYAMMSGTSMSAPQVAAAAAILLQEHPAWTPDQVKWLLVRTAMPVAGSVGSLDLARAVAFAGRPGRANGHAAGATFGLERSTDGLRRLRDQEMPPGSPTFDNASWNNASWNNASWNNASWNNVSWN